MTYPDFPRNDTPSAGELALDDRTALRRVGGLSTELADISEVEYRQLRLERVVLVGVWTEGSAADAEASLAELAALAETAGSEVLEGLIQRRDKPDASTYIGSGKAQELREVVVATGADTVICDGELSPAQLTALEKAVKVKVDRPHRADPRHLRSARHQPGGQGAGGVRADGVHAAQAARLGRVDVAAGRWARGRQRRRRGSARSRVRQRSRPTVVASASEWPSYAGRSRR